MSRGGSGRPLAEDLGFGFALGFLGFEGAEASWDCSDVGCWRSALSDCDK